MNNIEYYNNLLISQYRTKAKFKEWLNVLIQPFIDIGNCADNMCLAFDLDFAEGKQLDVLGEIVNQKRILPFLPSTGSNVLSDDDYRLVLRVKIIKNQWDGKLVTFEKLWNDVFTDNPLNYIDNQDMSITVSVGGEFSIPIQEMIAIGLLIPKPQGVKSNLSLGVAYFGYDEETTEISGYDVGFWRK